jgi:hypothetical protein
MCRSHENVRGEDSAYLDAPKRTVSLTVSEELLKHVREVTLGLTGLLKELFDEYLNKTYRRRDAQLKFAADVVVLWNQLLTRPAPSSTTFLLGCNT